MPIASSQPYAPILDELPAVAPHARVVTIDRIDTGVPFVG